MNEILNMLNALKADELEGIIMRANIMLEKKRKEEAEQAVLEQLRRQQEKIEQEKKRQQEIAELQRKLAELQSQTGSVPAAQGTVQGDNFVMRETSAAADKTASVQAVSCPHCRQMNPIGSQFCTSCGQKMTPPQPAPKAAPAQVACPHCHQPNDAGSQFCSNCGQRMAAQAQTASPAQAAQSPTMAPAGQVRYADESMKKWETLPGEYILRTNHEIVMLKPDGGKYAYYMEVTNRRILLTRESSGSKNAGMVARMGGGFVGALIAEGVKAASGAGPRPWLEIPLNAISNYGVQNKKEFFFVADQTYVLKNKSYEKLLPELIEKAKR